MNIDLEEIYQKAHQTNIMTQLDEIEMSIKAAKMLGQHYIVVNKIYDFEVIAKLKEREYIIERNNDNHPFIYTISWK